MSVSSHCGSNWLSYTHSAQQDKTTIAANLPNDEALRETKYRPTRKHHEISYAGEIAGERENERRDSVRDDPEEVKRTPFPR